MDRDTALLTCGEVAGVALRMTPEEAERAAAEPGLTDHNRAVAQAVCRFRRDLEEITRRGGGR